MARLHLQSPDEFFSAQLFALSLYALPCKLCHMSLHKEQGTVTLLKPTIFEMKLTYDNNTKGNPYHQGHPSNKPMMHIAYSLCFSKISKFSPFSFFSVFWLPLF